MGLKAKAVYWVRQFPFIYPRKIVGSCKEWILKEGHKKGAYFSQRGPWYKEIFPAGFMHNAAPNTVAPQNEKAFFANQDYPTPMAGLFYLQNCYLLGQKGFILSARHELFQEFSHNFNISSLKKFFRRNPFYTFKASAKKVGGVGAVLVSPESHNYYHWLSDVLPRIRLYESVFEQIDHFCVAASVPQKFLDILPAFGIRSDKVLMIAEKEKLHFDHLYVASLPGSEGRAPKWAVDYLRQILVKPPAAEPFRKLYFKRGDAAERRILNEEAIIVLLKKRGFEIADPGALSVAGQVALVADAKIVAGAHGAALSNLLFCADGAAVVELFSPDYFRTDCFFTLSAIRNFNYWYLAGQKPAAAKWGDMEVDTQLLEETLNRIG